MLENTWAVTKFTLLISLFFRDLLLITQYIQTVSGGWSSIHQPWNPTVICSPHLGRISLHRRGTPSRRCLAGPRNAQSDGNAAWRGVGRWGASRATMRVARRHRKKKWMLEGFWRFFFWVFIKFPQVFLYIIGWGRVDIFLISFLGIESTYIRSLSNHWPKLDQKKQGWKPVPRECFLADFLCDML